MINEYHTLDEIAKILGLNVADKSVEDIISGLSLSQIFIVENFLKVVIGIITNRKWELLRRWVMVDVDTALEIWQDYMLRVHDGGEGWPSKSRFEAIREYEGAPPRVPPTQFNTPLPKELPMEARVINTVLRKMREHGRGYLADVIMMTYIVMPRGSRKERANKLKLPLSIYRDRMVSAKDWITSALVVIN
jgi:hypothetical protein